LMHDLPRCEVQSRHRLPWHSKKVNCSMPIYQRQNSHSLESCWICWLYRLTVWT
jgi:hypothetical protein